MSSRENLIKKDQMKKLFLFPILFLSLISTPCLSEDRVEYREDRIANVDAELNCLLSENMFEEECIKERDESRKNKKSGYLDEEYQEDKWTVRVFKYAKKDSSDWSIEVSVNGEITHGDRFRVRMLPKNIELCERGNLVTTFYTTKKNKNISALSGVIPALLNNLKGEAQILFAIEFLLGHSVWIDLKWNKLLNIKEFFKDEKEISLKLLDSETVKIDDYFDISENRFSLIGLNDALDRAKNECIRIVNERNSE
jgi:hypothetical protein